MTDLFLSYARKDDEPFVAKLYDALSARGYDVWFDRQSMPNRGLGFSENIKRAVLETTRLLLIVGPYALKSDYVRKEWRTAYDACIPVIPLMRLAGYSDLPPELGRVDAPDFRDNAKFEATLDYLARQLGDDPAPLGDPLGRVPRLTDIYVHRAEPWAQLNAALRADDEMHAVHDDDDQITALVGVGGVGKSTLAAAFVRNCAARRSFADGLVWLYMGPNLTDADIPRRQADLGAALGDDRDAYIDIQSGTARLSLLMADKDALIVLEDVWDHHHAEAFFGLGAQCKLLVITRRGDVLSKLRVPDEKIIRLGELTADEALQLVENETGTPAGDHAEDQRALIDLLGGHPLAVTLAAAQLKKRGVDYTPKLLERLRRAAETDTPFKVLNMDDSDEDFNVALSMELSYNDLRDDTLREHLRRLGVLPAGETFSPALAGALWELEDEFEAEDEVFALADAELLSREGERFRLHPIVRAYAAALLRREDAYKAAFLRYADVMSSFTGGFTQEGVPPDEWEPLDAEAAHILAVGDALVAGYAGDDDLSQRAREFVWVATFYLNQRWAVRRPEWLEMGRALAHADGEQALEAMYLNNLGRTWDRVGEIHKALEYHDRALPLRRAAEDRNGEATTLNNIGMVWGKVGEYHKALDFYEQALTIQREVEDRYGEATTLNNIGGVWSRLGEQEKARGYFETALAQQRDIEDRLGVATALNNLGMTWFLQGNYDQALACYEESLPVRRALGDLSGVATNLSNIALILENRGDIAGATTRYNEALAFFREVGERDGEAMVLNNLAGVSDSETAFGYYDQALALYRAVLDRDGEATALNNIGLMWSERGDLTQALKYYEQSLDLARALGKRASEATALNNIAHLHGKMGDSRKAIEMYEQSLALSRAVGDRVGEANTLFNIGSTWLDLADTSQARTHYDAALDLYRALDDRANEAGTLGDIGYTCFKEGDYATATAFGQQGLAIYEALGAWDKVADTWLNIAANYEAAGQITAAVDAAETGRAIFVEHQVSGGGVTLADFDAFLARVR